MLYYDVKTRTFFIFVSSKFPLQKDFYLLNSLSREVFARFIQNNKQMRLLHPFIFLVKHPFSRNFILINERKALKTPPLRAKSRLGDERRLQKSFFGHESRNAGQKST